MFAKPAKTSGNALLKGKDAKKLRRDAASRFASTCDGPDDAKLQQLLPSKASVKKISYQAPSRMVVYAVDSPGGASEPLLFDVSGKGDLCFTVYALWRSPELLPPLVVHAPVSEFVLRGADVMLPGVVFSSAEEVAGLRKGELRAVFARGNPGAIAVGEMLVDAEDIARTGKKGRALKLWHVMGDELWKLGPKTVPNDGFIGDRVLSINAQTGEALDDSDQEEAETEVNVADISLEDEEKAAPEPEATEDQPLNEEDEAISKEQMDAWYVDSLLQALRSSKVKEKELPMLASTFHANVLLPSRRANVSLNLKQSSFKKLSAFLRQMEQRGLVAVVEKDGVQSIAGISRRHPDVLAHEVYITAEQVKLEEEAAANAAAGLPAFVPGQFAPEVEECLGLSPALKTLLANVPGLDVAAKKYWTAIEVRDAVAAYITANGLVDTQDKKFVRLDASLTDALFGKKAPAGGYPNRLARPDILNTLIGKCMRYNRIKLFPGHEPKFHGGTIRPIAIHAERSKRHNKTVITSIAFYQQFGIDGAAFAKEVQKKWGCSATTQPSEDKQKGEEIQVHGQMVNEVLDYLTSKYQINTTKYCVITYGKNVKPKKKQK